VVVLVEEGVPVPDGSARDELVRSMKLPASATEGVAFCILGSGFGAATRRAVITGLQLVSRPPYPVRIFESLDSAGEWVSPLVRQAGLTVAPVEVARAIREVRDAARVASRRV
jgi:hypothetical protein